MPHTSESAPGGVLSLDPRMDRIGYAYFENKSLLDWGNRRVEKTPLATRARKSAVPALIKLLDGFQPRAILLPNYTKQKRRSRYLPEVIRALLRECDRRDIVTEFVDESAIRGSFRSSASGRRPTLKIINKCLVRRFPELAGSLPRARRPWDPEQYVTPMFVAVALFVAWTRTV